MPPNRILTKGVKVILFIRFLFCVYIGTAGDYDL